MQTRLATASDRAALHTLGRAHIAEAAPEEEWDAAKANETFDRYLHTANPVFYVVEEKGEIIGYFAARVVDKPFTSGFFIELDVIYVMPRHRGSRAAALLLDTYDRWAALFGQIEQYSQHTDNVPDVLSRMLTKRGFKISGVILKK